MGSLVCRTIFSVSLLCHCGASLIVAQAPIDLPTSKQILPPVPGAPQRLNSLPMAMATSPDGRWIAVVNAGYGTAESNYEQSIAILDTASGKVQDFPEPRTDVRAPQTLYSGLQWSSDGKRLFVSIDSITAPEGGPAPDGSVRTGNGIAIYSFADGELTPAAVLPVPLQALAPGRTQHQLGRAPVAKGNAIPLPTGLALVKGSHGEDQLLVANEFADSVLLMDASTGAILKHFDLATNAVVPSTYPIAITTSLDGRHAYVALWNGSAIAELDLAAGRVMQTLPLLPPQKPIEPSSHPAAMVLGSDGRTLYVALANRDAVAVVDLHGEKMKLAGTLDTRLPSQQLFGAMPDALALSADGRELYVANSGSDAVAVFSTTAKLSAKTPAAAAGFLPTEWYPTALTVHGSHLLIATGKGTGTGPNGAKPKAAPHPNKGTEGVTRRPNQYIATLLYGSLADVDMSSARAELPKLTAAVRASNRMDAAQQTLPFASGRNPIKHVIYIIKENRTYDQIFGDLPVGDGDKSLTMYGEKTTPNQHKLALQFGVLDNFYDSGEVSGDGHVWSNAAISSDYTEKNWQQSYRGGERVYDFEGVVEEGYPLTEGISDVNEPESGYLWTNLARHGVSLYHMGEFISSKFCGEARESVKDPNLGTPEQQETGCPRPFIPKGEQIPANYGGGTSPYPWRIPLIKSNTATKPELVDHFDPLFPDFNLQFPDQLRYEEFQTHLKQWIADRAAGHDTMPSFLMLRFANDHTAGTSPGSPTPSASIADNDLAVGRAVEAISHSDFWNDTAFFILEDDAQAGADHVDAHRSISLVVSKYAPRAAAPLVDHTFYTTVSTVRTMEALLGVPPMNNNDAFAPLIASVFTGAGDQPAFAADYSNRDNGLIYQMNTPRSPGARQSSRMDFRHEDRADTRKLNAILWRDAMGDTPLPEQLKHPKGLKKDDDD